MADLTIVSCFRSACECRRTMAALGATATWRCSVATRRCTGSAEDQVRDAVVMPAGRAQEVLGCIGAADEQMQVVLPRVADAAVDLHAVLGAAHGGPASGCLCDVRGAMPLRIRGVDAHRGVVDGTTGPLEIERTVGQLVLYGLEAPDRHVELHPLLRV